HSLLGLNHQLVHDGITGGVRSNQFVHPGGLCGCVFGMRSDVEVETGTVRNEDVRGVPPGHNRFEHVAGDFVGRQGALGGMDGMEAVFGFYIHDAGIQKTSYSACGSSRRNARWVPRSVWGSRSNRANSTWVSVVPSTCRTIVTVSVSAPGS